MASSFARLRARIAACALAFFCSAAPLAAQAIHGTITDEQHNPMEHVTVAIPTLERRMATGADGTYAFERIRPGVYTIVFSRIGYETITREITADAAGAEVNVALAVSPLDIPAVTVTAKPQPAATDATAQSVAVLEGSELDRLRGQGVMESIQSLPGVSGFARGPLNMKPVIRGLTAQRVVVAEDGLRHDSQQWDDEQSPEIDALDVARIEVVRGPNSVLYGSDALGGVVNVVRHTPLTLSDRPTALSGRLTLNGFTNDRQGAGSLLLFGTGREFDYKGQVTVRETGNIRTPEGELPNSFTKEVNGSGTLGVREEWGNISLGFSHFGQEFHIASDDPGIPSPAQKIRHNRVEIASAFPLSDLRLELNGSYQDNTRMEYDDSGILDFEDSAAIHLHLTTVAGEAKLHHAPIGGLFGTVGASVMHQKNETLGLEPLIPGFEQTNVAGFVYEELTTGDVGWSGGLRFDSRSLDVDENGDLGVTAQSRSYSALTGTLGMVWHAAGPFSISLSAGRGWRSPIAEELFINGPDEGSIRFKVGEPNLNPEESFNTDASVRWRESDVNAEIAFFRNRINRFIYLAPNGEVDSATGFNKYSQRQANATLSGFEVSGEATIGAYLLVRGGADFVLARNEETDSWLPLTPANRFKAGAKATTGEWGSLLRPYISLDANIVLDQNRVGDFEDPTGGYTLWSVGAGCEVEASGQRIRIDGMVENLFDRPYVDHLSRYKGLALNPGRDFVLKLAVPFELVK